MSNPILAKTYTAGGAINPYAIVAVGAADGEVVAAADGTEDIIGVADQPHSAAAQGDRVDVTHLGIVEVEAGGVVPRGAAVTAGAAGVALASAPAAGVNDRIVGYALVSAVAGDIFRILLAVGEIQGAT